MLEINLEDSVMISISGEKGVVRGLAQYVGASPSVRVHYKSADGRAMTEWFDLDQVELIGKSS